MIGAIAAGSGSNIISGIVGDLSGSAGNSANAMEQGYTTNAPLNLLGAAGDPAGFLFNRTQYKKKQKYQMEQDAIKGNLIKVQTENMQLDNEVKKRKLQWSSDVMNYMLGVK
jgi:hypothetical protein